MVPCIEFRHGHVYQFLWWVEYEIREELACRYDAWSVDDSDFKFDQPQQERFNTYEDYLKRNYPNFFIHEQFIHEQIELAKQSLPKKFHSLIDGHD